METWLTITIISFSIAALIKVILNILFQSKQQIRLPPSPVNIPIIRHLLWIRKSITELEPIISSFHQKLGPIITLHIGFRQTVIIADHSLAHQALVQNSAVFADRPQALVVDSIGLSLYGSTWRILRRNLMSNLLHPSRLRSYSQVRKWSLDILLNLLESQRKSGDHRHLPVCVRVRDMFQYTMFSLLVFMCFGDKLDDEQIKEIQRVEYLVLANIDRFELNFWPRLSKILFRKQWSEFLQIEKDREDTLIPLIRARKKMKERENKNDHILSYVDTLLDLQLSDEKRKLTEKEMLILCEEFINAGSDSTAAVLQWIMAHLVKDPSIQEKLFTEIKSVVPDGEEEVKEDDLQRMPYLKAVILEALRRHPPAHFVIPHTITEDVVLADKYFLPKNVEVNFMVADMGWDPNVWEDPMAFKPERFVGDGEVIDITGSKEIKMMPFGAGRRICPAGYGFALLHLEYFLANLVWKYEWKLGVDEDDIDLSETLDFTSEMKNPLQARISPRFK
ncbi:cytochrome P450 89A2-like [Mercurialis annua]|uniref:cytochrome P450 89A2-like n=1 Tax=Mercurialis annua TaxID=3986 RepID=UPI00215F42F0|nr:cytochrome P450 89A2-like [Mercurialis annua]